MKTDLFQVVVFVILFSITYCGSAQTTAETKMKTDWIKDIKSSVTPYGSIRIGAGFAGGGEMGISNNAPRIGIRMKHALSKKESDNFNVIGRIEFGLNLISRDETVSFSVDPGAGIAQVGDAIFTRLGYVGVSYKAFELTVGKQNSVYYSLGAIEVDKTLAFGGSAIGVWNAGSDGGVSGTGRANQVIILAYKKGGLSLGLQTQVRNISANSKSVDTYGFGANYAINGFGLGIGYNKVNDGVDNPLPNQAKDGDEAFVVSTSYDKRRFLVAASFSRLKQHEKVGLADGSTFFYDASGIEVYARYKFSDNNRWHVAVSFNYLKPDSGQDLEEYDSQFGLVEVGYNFKKSSHLFASSKIDQSKNFLGDRRNENIYGVGIRFGF